MRREAIQHLLDVADAGRHVVAFTTGMDVERFLDDRRTRDAVKFNFMVIGEALGRARKAGLEFVETLSEWHRIIGFRHQLAHHYDDISDEIVWKTISEKLPILLREIEALLAEAADDADTGREEQASPT